MSTHLGKQAASSVSLGLVALICAGCSPATSTITGTVKYKDKLLPGGSVTFVTANGTATGAINSEGAYTAEKVPVGNAKVTVYYSSGPKMMGLGKDKGLIPKDTPLQNSKQGGLPKIDLPARYGDPESSGLSVVVTSGQNPPFNIELKD